MFPAAIHAMTTPTTTPTRTPLPCTPPEPGARYRKIGMLGGVAWPSTVDIYRSICQQAQAWHDAHLASAQEGPAVMPTFAIESVDVNQSYHRRGQQEDEASWQAYDAYFREALLRLQASGAEFALIASNTPHNRLDTIVQGVDIPVMDIFETVALHCQQLQVRHVLVLGTGPTMAGTRFPQALRRHGIQAHVPPCEADRRALMTLILSLQAGTAQGADEAMGALVARAWESLGLAGVIGTAVGLSCTELPLAFPMADPDACHFSAQGQVWINTTMVHAQAAFARALKA